MDATPATKRARLDVEAVGADRGNALSEEQRLRIEKNRLLALEKRQMQLTKLQHQPSPQQQELPPQELPLQEQLSEPAGTTEKLQQLAIIERNRSAALERRRQLQAAAIKESVPAQTEATAREDVGVSCGPPSSEVVSDDTVGAAASDSVSDSSECHSESDSDDSTSDSLSSESESSSSSSTSAQRSSASKQTGKGVLSFEARARIERNRLAALARRKQQQQQAADLKQLEAPEPAGKQEKATLLAKDTSSKHEEEKGYVPGKIRRDAKQTLVSQLLCRWWYVFPDWPPKEEEYYAERLKERHLYQVDVAKFEMVPEVDELGRTKVFALRGWTGLYRDAQGNLVDLRPAETCPSYDNMMKKPSPELMRLLIMAFEKQLAELEAQPRKGPEDEEQRVTLRKQVKEAKRKAGFALHFMPVGRLQK